MVHPIYETPATVVICQGESILLGGSNQTQPGLYYDTLQSVNNCDSVIATTLIVNPSYEVAIAASICESGSILLEGTLQTQAGIYRDTFTTVNNCDSIITTTLSVNPTAETNLTAEICEGETYFVGGASQTLSGIYYDTLNTSLGCDSVLITALTVHPAFTTRITVEICEGESHIAGGAAQTVAGSYVDTLLTIAGCCLLYTSPSPRDQRGSRMPSSA